MPCGIVMFCSASAKRSDVFRFHARNAHYLRSRHHVRRTHHVPYKRNTSLKKPRLSTRYFLAGGRRTRLLRLFRLACLCSALRSRSCASQPSAKNTALRCFCADRVAAASFESSIQNATKTAALTGGCFCGRGRRTRTLKNGFGDRYVTITSCPYSVCKRYHTTAANKMQAIFSAHTNCTI